MPDNTYMASFYFTTIDNEGWSENIYIQSTTVDQAVTTAAGYIAPRMGLSPDNVDMVYGKVSDVAIKGDSKIVLPTMGNYPFIGTWVADPVGSYLEANTALLIELVSDPSKKNRIFLRGLSLDVVTGREFKNPTGYAAKLTALTTFLTGTCYTRNKDIADPTGFSFSQCTDAFFTRVTARKPGRPFSIPRGRRFAHRTTRAATVAGRSSTASAPPTSPSTASHQAQRR